MSDSRSIWDNIDFSSVCILVFILFLLFLGSPFLCTIIDGSKAVASGDGLQSASVNRPAYFTVNSSNLGEANLMVKITCKW